MEDLTHQDILQVREGANILLTEQEIEQAIESVAKKIEAEIKKRCTYFSMRNERWVDVHRCIDAANYGANDFGLCSCGPLS